MQKTPFAVHYGPILPILGQNSVFFKILFLQVFLILNKYHCARCKKKLMRSFQASLVLKRRTHSRLNAYIDKHEFIGPFWLKARVQQSATSFLSWKFSQLTFFWHVISANLLFRV